MATAAPVARVIERAGKTQAWALVIGSMYMARSPQEDEAAAIAAAIAHFEAETAAVEPAAGDTVSPWQRAALVEGIGAKGTVQKHLEGGAQWQS